jgi:two-component system response regulator GlrR
MQRLFALLRQLEGSLVPVLVQGPTGSGKEVACREIHEHSPVSSGPFVAVNCGGMDRPLARSELFGHKRGAFTGALESRVGAFELASGGTLFLDEVGELPLEVQPLLLRAIEQRVITPLGATRERRVDARIISATHRDLLAEVRAGRFREDLFYRLCVVSIKVPPLTASDDIELLAHHFATTDELELGELSPGLVHTLKARTWPGNGRELQNALRAFFAVGKLPESTLPTADQGPSLLHAMAASVDLGVPYERQKRAIHRLFLSVYVERLLESTGGNQSEAARVSGMARSYISRLLRHGGQPSVDDQDAEARLIA